MRRLGDILKSGSRSLGTWAQIPSPEVVDMLGGGGFDFIVIDCQHASFGMQTAEHMARAAAANGLAAAVRISRLDEVEILKALDAGISHVIVPDLGSATEAARAVAATRFAPEGTRGACPCVRSGGHFVSDWHAYAQAQEANSGIVALVETADGIADIEAIAATPGLAALMPGPFDLAVSMGSHGDWRKSSVVDALRRLVEAAKENDVPAIMPVFAPDPSECRDLVEKWTEAGVQCFMLGSDKIIAANSFNTWVKNMRSS